MLFLRRHYFKLKSLEDQSVAASLFRSTSSSLTSIVLVVSSPLEESSLPTYYHVLPPLHHSTYHEQFLSLLSVQKARFGIVIFPLQVLISSRTLMVLQQGFYLD